MHCKIHEQKKSILGLSFVYASLLRKLYKRRLEFYSFDCWIGIEFGYSDKSRKIYLLLKNAAWFLIIRSSSFMCLKILSWSLVNLFKKLYVGSLVLIDSSNTIGELRVLLKLNLLVEDIRESDIIQIPEIRKGKFLWHYIIQITIGGIVYCVIRNDLFIVIRELSIANRSSTITN
jgi:hypothetical protein